MPSVDSELVVSALRLWVAAGCTALLILFGVLAFFQSQLRIANSPAQRAGFVALAAVFGAAIAWALFDGSSGDRGAAKRQALALRAEQLHAEALAPGSPLACLDPLAGGDVEAACEKTLFASPANVAAASSYVAAQLALLSSMTAYASGSGEGIDDTLLPLRRSLEADRFGIVAHVLEVRDGCTAQNCRAFALLHDAKEVRAHLDAGTLDRYLEHYLTVWDAPPGGAVAEATRQQTGATTSGPRKMVNIDFPSAASIPAVSIMNPEPAAPTLPGAAPAATAGPNPAPAAHRSRKQSGPNTAQSAPASAGSVEPIWPEPVPPPPSAQAATTPVSTAPMQLNPTAPTPAGTTAR